MQKFTRTEIAVNGRVLSCFCLGADYAETGNSGHKPFIFYCICDQPAVEELLDDMPLAGKLELYIGEASSKGKTFKKNDNPQYK